MNTHWNILKITTFWESHGKSLWVVIDGFPPNFEIDKTNIQHELNRRKPWQSKIVSQRNEDNNFEIRSWIFDWKTTWHPIVMEVKNKDQKSKDYDNIKDTLRPSHADHTYNQKYKIRDYKWWWRSSGRETVSRVLAWALAKQYLKDKLDVEIYAYTKQIGDLVAQTLEIAFIENNPVRTGDPQIAKEMKNLIEKVRKAWDSIWWIIACEIFNPPKNLWEPVFGKIKSKLANSMLSIWAVTGFQYGLAYSPEMYIWSRYNEWFIKWTDDLIQTKNNHHGWILWGITTWENINFEITVKPTPSISKKQKTLNIYGKEVTSQIHWRHDPCLLPRIIPVVESMAALDILDLLLLHNSKNLNL